MEANRLNILIVNGPNLNLIGRRSPVWYGKRSMEQIVSDLQKAHPDIHFTYFQSNHEGALIDRLQEAGLNNDENTTDKQYAGIILNAGGYTHTGIALRDTVEWLKEEGIAVVEVHLSDITKREPFRQHSLLTEVSNHTFIGKDAYEKATLHIMSLAR